MPVPQIPLKQQNIPILTPEKTNILDKNLGSSGTDIKNANSQELKPPNLIYPLPFRPNPNTMIDKSGPPPPSLVSNTLSQPQNFVSSAPVQVPVNKPPVSPLKTEINPSPSLFMKSSSNNKEFSQSESQSKDIFPPSLLSKPQMPAIIDRNILTNQPDVNSKVSGSPIVKNPEVMVEDMKTQGNNYKNQEIPSSRNISSKPPPLKFKSQNQSLQLDPENDQKINQNPQLISKTQNFDMPSTKFDNKNLTSNINKNPQNNPEYTFSSNNSLTLPSEDQKGPDFESNSSISPNNSGILVIGRDINSLSLQYLDIKVCFICKSNKCLITLKCEHVLCENCLQKNIENTAEMQIFHSEKVKIRPLCPSCKKPIYEKLFIETSYYKNIISKYTERYINVLFGTKMCFSCKKIYSLTRFFKTPNCQHQCKECVATEINLSKTKCPFCPEIYDIESLKNTRQKCSCCKEDKFYVIDCIFSICKEHYHCLKCLQIALCSRKCGKCERNVGKEDYCRVYKRLRRFREQFT
ncbi:hypothetical protein SteCoe_25546 [Stentor coeruleus]|uniref:RING-type domain-containing protein n=1 Tax=Stentor coeruleus TaxID=5963 RepID=A0A1R2BF26_9CILI|nr:hypothetical protein SteCoe_25546 [Stentor coeruleus]